MVDVFVGPDKVKFTLPKSLACYHSPVLKRTFEGYFKEAHEARLELPEDDPDTFAMLAQWIYQERLTSIENLSSEQAEKSFQDRLTLYYLAARYCMAKLQNDIIRQLASLYVVISKNKPISAETIIDVYKATDDGSPLRLLVCDAAATYFSKSEYGLNVYKEALSTACGFGVQFLTAIHDSLMDDDDPIKRFGYPERFSNGRASKPSDRYLVVVEESEEDV